MHIRRAHRIAAAAVAMTLASGGVAAASAPAGAAGHAAPGPWAASSLRGVLAPPDAAPGSTIGYAAALSANGSTAVLGAPDANGYNGAVYVYTAAGSGWRQQAELAPADATWTEVGFSAAVSADGRTIVAGAPMQNGGRVYVFTESGGAWRQADEIVTPSGSGIGAFGDAVALSGDGSTIAVGDQFASGDKGAVYLYRRTAAGWTGGTPLTGADSAASDLFGSSVALSYTGSTMAVGARGRAGYRGAVYTFGRRGGSWAQSGELTAGDGAADDRLGTSVALSGTGDVIVSGAPYHGTGVAYTFQRSWSSWRQTGELTAWGKRDFPSDAISVAVSGDGSVVGVGLPSRNYLLGAAAVFTRRGASYTQAATLVPSEYAGLTSGAGSAVAVSADGHTALLGSPTVSDDFQMGAGFVYQDHGAPYTPAAAASGAPAHATAATTRPATTPATATQVSALPGRHPLLDAPHRTAAVCAAAAPGYASCDARVVTSTSLKRLTSAGYVDGYTPAELRAAYGLPQKSTATTTVAVVDAYANPDAEASLDTYRSEFGLPPADFTQVGQDGGTTLPAGNADWGTEEMIDLEMVSAICPGCRILYVGANSASFDDLGTAVNTAVRLGAKVVSNSYGGTETAASRELQAEYYQHPGVAITASSGDDGYGVSVPAAFTSVVAVSGTTLTLDASGSRVSESAWEYDGSGCARFIAKPAWQRDGYCRDRTVADVSADGDPNTGVAVYDGYGAGGWVVAGGTSVSAPIIAGVYGLTGHTSGLPARRLYAAPRGSFHDITDGLTGTCSAAYLCSGARGYDGPTGLGSPNGLAAF